ncbi:hybrid sensor histidine kinase/response regulator [Hyalangium gracile]|uniref:hybrid sensor histidine kinase/response regulator n=1 Tax=Hyalangium gracile TaxID=394092 RepID=UPI001CCCA51E|nr:ATP-binding protein [Hyalangium gracile]
MHEHRTLRLSELAEQGALALRRQVHDLFALLELPAQWRGREPREIAQSFVEVITHLLRLDLAFIRIHEAEGALEQRFPVDLDAAELLATVQEASEGASILFGLPRPNTVGRTVVRVVTTVPLGEQGIVIVGSWRQNFPTSHELQLLRTATNQAALAMQSSREARTQRCLVEERGRLEHMNRVLTRARLEAEARQQRADFLSEASAILGSSLDFTEALTAIAHLVVPRFADWVMLRVAVRVSSAVEEMRTVVVHRDASRTDQAREYARALLSTSGEPRVRMTNNSVLAPIAARGRRLGVVILSSEQPGRYGTETLGMIEELGFRAGVALENVRLYEAACEADRRKDEFLAMLGHELRNPLSPILTALQLMRQKAPHSVERERTIIERQIDHMVRLVDDLLDVSRITRGKIQLKRGRVDVLDIVTRAVEMTAPLFEQRSHHLELDLPQAPQIVDGDSARLAQVVANLLNNAAKYTEPGGRVRVCVAPEGEQSVVRVRDTGTGISPEVLPRVFEMFVQDGRAIDRSQGGLGLGLAIVRSLIELHGGTVSAHSEGVGRGSEFVVRLPLVKARSQELPALPAPGPALATEERGESAPRVLVVDDNQDAAEMLAEALGMVGFVTHTAADGPSGLEAALAFRPDVAVLDIGLPVMDGYELAGRLRAQPALHGLKLIALTGYGQESDRLRAHQAGFDLHVVKPVEFAQLLGAIRGLTSASPQASAWRQQAPGG